MRSFFLPFISLGFQLHPGTRLCTHLHLELLQRCVVLGPPVKLFRIWDVLLQLRALVQEASQGELLQRSLREREVSTPNPGPPSPSLISMPHHLEKPSGHPPFSQEGIQGPLSWEKGNDIRKRSGEADSMPHGRVP